MYDTLFVLSHQYLATGGGVCVEYIVTFIVTVAGGVVCHYIIKWLDSKHKDDKE